MPNPFRSQNRNDLDFLLSHPPRHNNLNENLIWLGKILDWVLSKSPLKLPEHDFSTGQTQALRVKWMVYLLDRNPEWKKDLSRVLGSITSETQIFDLLISGLHQKSGIFSESLQRLSYHFMPQLPDDRNLGIFLSKVFESDEDALALMKIDPLHFKKLIQLFTASENSWDRWKFNSVEAIRYLSLQIASLGQSSSLRQLLPYPSFAESPFYQVNTLVMQWQPTESTVALHHEIEKCNRAVDELYTHMDDHGVSIDMVYQLERLRFLLRRLKELLRLFESSTLSVEHIQKLISLIILENIRSRSLSALFGDNTTLISKKIAETSAETGEHYIAHDKKEYFELFISALGGGAVTAITALMKLLIGGLPGSPFWIGFVSSVNYSVSFLVLQFGKFTLATKQPAMTAAVISQKLDHKEETLNLNPAVEEIFHVIRSQFVSVLGNATSVIPSVIFISAAFEWLRGKPFLSYEKASHVLEGMSILGPTPFYAAFTGVLLFLSSLCSGWFYHWIRYRNLPQALAKNPRMIKWFGPERARLFSQIFKRNSAGLAANISLGFLLGMAPFFADFFGLPLDIRHVTLSIGSITAAIMTLGAQILDKPTFVYSVLGIISMAFFNIMVAFTLALLVALRAQKFTFKLSFELLRAIFSEVRKRAWGIFSFRR